MTTVLNRDSIKVKRDLQKRIENWVIEYCNALEENFKQYSINSYKRNIESPSEVSKGYTSYYEEQLQKIEDGTANLYKFDYQVGKKYIKVFNLQMLESIAMTRVSFLYIKDVNLCGLLLQYSILFNLTVK